MHTRTSLYSLLTHIRSHMNTHIFLCMQDAWRYLSSQTQRRLCPQKPRGQLQTDFPWRLPASNMQVLKIYIYIYIYIHTHLHMPVYTYVCMYTYLHIHTCWIWSPCFFSCAETFRWGTERIICASGLSYTCIKHIKWIVCVAEWSLWICVCVWEGIYACMHSCMYVYVCMCVYMSIPRHVHGVMMSSKGGGDEDLRRVLHEGQSFVLHNEPLRLPCCEARYGNGSDNSAVCTSVSHHSMLQCAILLDQTQAIARAGSCKPITHRFEVWKSSESPKKRTKTWAYLSRRSSMVLILSFSALVKMTPPTLSISLPTVNLLTAEHRVRNVISQTQRQELRDSWPSTYWKPVNWEQIPSRDRRTRKGSCRWNPQFGLPPMRMLH